MNTSKRDKIAGAIYGFAIGDAMGATTEFMDSWQIKKKYGQVTNIIGGGWLRLKPGEVTDDTQMTMCVMHALMNYPEDFKNFERLCADNFVEWFKSSPKDIGGQCARGIYEIVLGRRIGIDNDALGNGSLMRALPCAILNKINYNFLQGKLTHNNLKCDRIILEYSDLIKTYLDGNFPYVPVTQLQEPTGYIQNTYNNSLYWSSKDSFEEAIIGAVNHGGDADTIAAITGSLAGARFGYENIPTRWINQLNPDVKIFLENFKKFVFSYLQI